MSDSSTHDGSHNLEESYASSRSSRSAASRSAVSSRVSSAQKLSRSPSPRSSRSTSYRSSRSGSRGGASASSSSRFGSRSSNNGVDKREKNEAELTDSTPKQQRGLSSETEGIAISENSLNSSTVVVLNNAGKETKAKGEDEEEDNTKSEGTAGKQIRKRIVEESEVTEIVTTTTTIITDKHGNIISQDDAVTTTKDVITKRTELEPNAREKIATVGVQKRRFVAPRSQGKEHPAGLAVPQLMSAQPSESSATSLSTPAAPPQQSETFSALSSGRRPTRELEPLSAAFSSTDDDKDETTADAGQRRKVKMDKSHIKKIIPTRKQQHTSLSPVSFAVRKGGLNNQRVPSLGVAALIEQPKASPRQRERVVQLRAPDVTKIPSKSARQPSTHTSTSPRASQSIVADAGGTGGVGTGGENSRKSDFTIPRYHDGPHTARSRYEGISKLKPRQTPRRSDGPNTAEVGADNSDREGGPTGSPRLVAAGHFNNYGYKPPVGKSSGYGRLRRGEGAQSQAPTSSDAVTRNKSEDAGAANSCASHSISSASVSTLLVSSQAESTSQPQKRYRFVRHRAAQSVAEVQRHVEITIGNRQQLLVRTRRIERAEAAIRNDFIKKERHEMVAVMRWYDVSLAYVKQVGLGVISRATLAGPPPLNIADGALETPRHRIGFAYTPLNRQASQSDHEGTNSLAYYTGVRRFQQPMAGSPRAVLQKKAIFVRRTSPAPEATQEAAKDEQNERSGHPLPPSLQTHHQLIGDTSTNTSHLSAGNSPNLKSKTAKGPLTSRLAKGGKRVADSDTPFNSVSTDNRGGDGEASPPRYRTSVSTARPPSSPTDVISTIHSNNEERHTSENTEVPRSTSASDAPISLREHETANNKAKAPTPPSLGGRLVAAGANAKRNPRRGKHNEAPTAGTKSRSTGEEAPQKRSDMTERIPTPPSPLRVNELFMKKHERLKNGVVPPRAKQEGGANGTHRANSELWEAIASGTIHESATESATPSPSPDSVDHIKLNPEEQRVEAQTMDNSNGEPEQEKLVECKRDERRDAPSRPSELSDVSSSGAQSSLPRPPTEPAKAQHLHGSMSVSQNDEQGQVRDQPQQRQRQPPVDDIPDEEIVTTVFETRNTKDSMVHPPSGKLLDGDEAYYIPSSKVTSARNRPPLLPPRLHVNLKN